jgi:hypothetical protein
MRDRRRQPWRIHTMTLGAVLAVMGMYAFSPMDTSFTATLARMGLEEAWGVAMILGGLTLGVSAPMQRRYARWVGNMGGMMAAGWTFSLCWTAGILTPTVAACGVIAVGCAWAMLRDAFAGREYRCMVRQTGRWEVASRGRQF